MLVEVTDAYSINHCHCYVDKSQRQDDAPLTDPASIFEGMSLYQEAKCSPCITSKQAFILTR